jgi:uncharacterized protein (DUF952 family)
MKTDAWIVHICSNQSWQQACIAGQYSAPSLETEGFIHCSRPDQILKVANHYYPARNDLVLLWIDPEILAAELRWEPVEADIFPHIYGPVNLEAVQSTTEFLPDSAGVFRNLPRLDP